jgi:protein-tyrosine-phosphatase
MIVYQKLIFVGDTDTCLAPMAAAIFHNGSLKEEMEVESRGLVALFPEPINEKAEAVMINKGIPRFTHTAKQLEEEDLEERNLVLAMTKKQYVAVQDKFGERENLFSLSSYIQAEGDVPDPYGKSLKDYAQCVDILQEYIAALEKKLDELDWKEVENELW